MDKFPHHMRIKPGLLSYELQYKHPDHREHQVHSTYATHEAATEAKKRLKQTAEHAPAKMEAQANLMKEERLKKAADQKQAVAEGALKDEKRMERTQSALGQLGAGKPYGSL